MSESTNTVVTGIAVSNLPSFNYAVQSASVTGANQGVACIIADASTSSSLTPNIPFLAGSVSAVTAAAGAGSNIDQVYQGYRTVDSVSPVYILPCTISSGEPGIATAIAGLKDLAVYTFVSPYSDAPSIAAIDTALNTTTGRWSNQSQLFGFHCTAREDTASNLTTYAASENSQYSSVLGTPVTGQNTAYVAGTYGATVNLNVVGAPNRPLHYLALPITAPSIANQFTKSNRNALMGAGLTTYGVTDAGVCQLDGAKTMYTTNAQGISDTTYSNVTRMYTLRYCIEYFRSAISPFLVNRYVILPNGSQLTGNAYATTPAHILGTAIGAYSDLVNLGYATDLATFMANAQASLSTDGNGVELYAPLTLSGELNHIDVAFTVGN